MHFETERLIIRKPRIDDADHIFNNYTHDEEVTKYLTWAPHEKLESTVEWIKFCIDSWDINKIIPFIIWHKIDKQAIGMIHFNINNFKVNFGYVLAQKYWNQGLMTEAAKPVIDFLLARDEIYRIEAIHDIENPASGRVMEKLGMQFEGILRRNIVHPNVSHIPRDSKMYSIVKS